MKWTYAPPTKPGWYWRRDIWKKTGQEYTQIVHLYEYDLVQIQMIDTRQWAGPIPEPEE